MATYDAGMSIWGKRVDAWYDSKTGGNRASKVEINRAGLNALWQIALVLLVALVAVLVLRG